MIAALDVRYDEESLTGRAAAVVFERWDDALPLAEYTATFSGVKSYVPGQFFKRELPCLLAVLKKVREPLDQIIVDGFVSLGDKPGLGIHLWEALDRKVAIVGVAKNHFRFATPVEVVRGSSKRPLFVTAVGVDPSAAAESIRQMHGANRIPTLLKHVDQRALDLPFESVGDTAHFEGDDARFDQSSSDDAFRWLKTQARHIVWNEDGTVHWDCHPLEIVGFEILVAQGSEPMEVFLAAYPKTIQVTDERTGRRRRLRTERHDWCGQAFCKTQYASDPQFGGVANFLRAHLAVCRMLDRAKELGLVVEVSDEGEFFEKRDIQVLVKEVGQMNEQIAALVGRLGDLPAWPARTRAGNSLASRSTNATVRSPHSVSPRRPTERGSNGRDFLTQCADTFRHSNQEEIEL